jgi:hypothetical protein
VRAGSHGKTVGSPANAGVTITTATKARSKQFRTGIARPAPIESFFFSFSDAENLI